MQVRICPKCGRYNLPTAWYCANSFCGETLSVQTITEVATPLPPDIAAVLEQDTAADAARVEKALAPASTSPTPAGPAQPAPHLRPVLISPNTDLHDYIFKSTGIGRGGMNVMIFVGLFIFGWLIAVAFQSLGKGNRGWVYLVPMIGLLAFSRLGDPVLAALLVLLGLAIYAAGAIDANMILSRVQSSARDTIALIDRQGAADADALLVKGFLLHKALQEKERGVEVLASALQVPGGDPTLLNLAGVTMTAQKRYEEAVGFFERAAAGTTDKKLLQQIKVNRALADKKTAKARR